MLQEHIKKQIDAAIHLSDLCNEARSVYLDLSYGGSTGDYIDCRLFVSFEIPESEYGWVEVDTKTPSGRRAQYMLVSIVDEILAGRSEIDIRQDHAILDAVELAVWKKLKAYELICKDAGDMLWLSMVRAAIGGMG